MAVGFKSATVNASSVPATQTNFPSYVDLSRLGITTLAEAQSVRVYADSAKTTEWAREIVSATEMHVKIPSLTSTVVMYVDYDGSRADYAVTDTYGRNAVWTNNYIAVWHMNATTDSTGNSVTLSATSTPTLASAKIGDGYTYDGTDRHNLTYNTAIPDGTLSIWFNYTSIRSGFGRIFSKTQAGVTDVLVSAVDSSNRVNFFINDSANLNTSFSTLSTSTWYKYDFTWDGSNVITSKNGAVETNTASTKTVQSNSQVYAIGGTPVNSHGLNGQIDEVRLASINRDANWITTEYNNQSNESSFWGTWTDVSGGATTPRNLMMMGVGM